MKCKLKMPDGSDCGVQIDYDPDTKTAKNMDGSAHSHPKKKFWANKKAIPIETELEIVARIATLEETVSKQGEAIKALVLQLKGQETL